MYFLIFPRIITYEIILKQLFASGWVFCPLIFVYDFILWEFIRLIFNRLSCHMFISQVLLCDSFRREYTGVCLWQTKHSRFRNKYIKVALYSYVVQFDGDLYTIYIRRAWNIGYSTEFCFAKYRLAIHHNL